jgi:hypothetical protein
MNLAIIFIKLVLILQIQLNGFLWIPKKQPTKWFAFKHTSAYREPDDDDQDKKKTNMLNMNIYYTFDFSKPSNPFKSNYTLVWFDCQLCRDLQMDMKRLRLEYEYVDFTAANLEHPILLENDEFVSNDLFDIYSYLFPH